MSAIQFSTIMADRESTFARTAAATPTRIFPKRGSSATLMGLFADGSGSSTGININISESVAVENQGNGIGAYSPGGGAPVTVSVKDSHISGNITNGLGALGAAASGAGSAAIAVGSTMITA